VPLKLVLGPANSAKAGEVLGAYGAATRDGAVLVVPTVADAGHYARELAGRGIVIGAEVTTFAGLAGRIAAKAGYSAPRLSVLQRERVIRRAVARADLALLAASAEQPGFTDAAGALIAELQRSLVTPQRFGRALRSWAGEDAGRNAYARELAAIYHGYAAELERIGFADSELFAWRAIDALRAAPRSWGGRPVCFYGFDDLQQLQLDAIEALARVAEADVVVSLTYEPARPALAARSRAVQELRAFAAEIVELPAAIDYYEHPALYGLERGIFGVVSEPVDPGGAIALLESGGELAEAELVAAEVLGLIRAGFDPGEIAIVYRSPQRAAPLIERVLAGEGVPVACDRELAFAHTTLGRGVLALARCALAGGDCVRQLPAYLRTPGQLERPELADALELAIRRGSVVTVDEARERLGFRLGEVDAVAASRDPLAELARIARRMLAAPGAGAAPRLGADQSRDAAALAALLNAVDELEQLSERPVGADAVEVLERLLVRSAGSGEHAVLLAGPLEIRARRFRAVFVCGLQEGEFPAPAAPEPFLSDERRHELALASGLALEPAGDGLERERYLFYACVSRPTARLYLSYRSSDEDGNLALRSPFLADVDAVLAPGWGEGRRRRLLADVVWDASEAPTARALQRSLASAAGGWVAPDMSRRALGPAALAVARHHEVVSAGALETYAECPVKWMVEKELQPDRFGPDPYPLARGDFIHRALERVFGRLEGALSPASLAEAEGLLSEAMAQLPAPAALGRAGALRTAALRSIEADLRRYLRAEAASGGEWTPHALEQRFGFDEEGSLPALELDGVRLRGVIDRVDVDLGSGFAVVRDYKSGSARREQTGSRWREDRQLQVALYMLVVRELMGLEPAAGVYQPLGGRDLRPRGIFSSEAPALGGTVQNDERDAAALDEELAAAALDAVWLASALRAGTLVPAPETCSRTGCRYPGICRSSA
jgi:superfamily I DNA/RNA helicase/RecB family exonuclease